MPWKCIEARLITEVDLDRRPSEPPLSLTLAVHCSSASDCPSLATWLQAVLKQPTGICVNDPCMSCWTVLRLRAQPCSPALSGHDPVDTLSVYRLSRSFTEHLKHRAIGLGDRKKMRDSPHGTAGQNFYRLEENKVGRFKAHKLCFILYHQLFQQWQGNRNKWGQVRQMMLMQIWTKHTIIWLRPVDGDRGPLERVRWIIGAELRSGSGGV